MKLRFYIICLILAGIPLLGYSQGRKTIKTLGITSQTVKEYFVEEGIKDPVVESIEKYDTNGNVIELQEFNSEGQIKNWKKFKYDADENKIEETSIDAKGKVEERTAWIYKDGLLREKQYYDSRDRLTKRKEYIYEYRKE